MKRVAKFGIVFIIILAWVKNIIMQAVPRFFENKKQMVMYTYWTYVFKYVKP
jgi:hypothetical protein